MRFSICGGSVSFGENTILSDINFEIKNKEKIAIVGRNGCGKSTLLKLICSDREVLDAFDGNKDGFSKDISVGYLKQMTFDDDNITLDGELQKSFSKLISMKEELDGILAEMENGGSPELAEKYTNLENDFKLNGGYYYQKEYETVLKNFGFTGQDKNRKLKEFSGGQRTRIGFVKLLLSKPDILLLDEPTNHLDMKTVSWLEEYLLTYPKAVVVVSHDRMFLDRVAEIIYDIEHKKLKRYVGNYSKFQKIKEEAYKKQEKEYIAQQKELKKENELIERFRYKATKAKMVQSRIKAIERRDLIEPPMRFDLKAFYSDTKPIVKSGNEVIKCSNLLIGYNKPLAKVDFQLLRGQKMGVIGANGIGKTTLLKTLVGKLSAIGGGFSFGVNVKIGYFDQQLMDFNDNETVLDNYWNAFPSLTETEARSDLGAFLFSGEDVFKPAKILSGGEKVRLALCKIFKTKPNLLILDEPTNHTDIVGKEALEEMLSRYEGTLICVSHDRYFINSVCDTILAFEEDGVTFNNFGFDRYEELKKIKENDIKEDTKPNACDKPKEEKKKHISPLKELNKVTKKREKTEEKIALKEEEIEGVKQELSYPENASDFEKLSALSKEIEDLQIELSVLMNEWEELSLRETELYDLVENNN
ncbi:MAG: ABC-F family ATP-binding cassette domain-containing protein [Clostridia bacterium]|nr:ABC-F family ATP-binding cassette domain-containing protein [Clostridia bacterium]